VADQLGAQRRWCMALSGSSEGVPILWNVETGDELRRFEGEMNWITSLAFSADGRTALSALGIMVQSCGTLKAEPRSVA